MVCIPTKESKVCVCVCVSEFRKIKILVYVQASTVCAVM